MRFTVAPAVFNYFLTIFRQYVAVFTHFIIFYVLTLTYAQKRQIKPIRGHEASFNQFFLTFFSDLTQDFFGCLMGFSRLFSRFLVSFLTVFVLAYGIFKHKNIALQLLNIYMFHGNFSPEKNRTKKKPIF